MICIAWRKFNFFVTDIKPMFRHVCAMPRPLHRYPKEGALTLERHGRMVELGIRVLAMNPVQSQSIPFQPSQPARPAIASNLMNLSLLNE